SCACSSSVTSSALTLHVAQPPVVTQFSVDTPVNVVQVSGAGNSAFNGNYVLDPIIGTYHKDTDPTYPLRYDTADHLWKIWRYGQTYYTAPQVTGPWTTGQYGTAPAPTSIIGTKVCDGNDTAFEVTAQNALSYQWRKDGHPIQNATDARLETGTRYTDTG